MNNIAVNMPGPSALQMSKAAIERFELEWPVTIKLAPGLYEGMVTRRSEHVLHLCEETDDAYLNELMAGAKLSEIYDEPLLSSYDFEDKESKEVREEYAGAFFSLVLPVRTVWQQQVIKQYLDPEEYKRDIDFIEQIYHEWEEIGDHAQTPFNFFAYYLLLEREGRKVSAPPQLERYTHAMWQFSRLANATPSAETLIEAYNLFAPPGLPRAQLTEKRKIRFIK